MLLMALSGCEKFLDADQPLQVDQEQVFSTEKGFTEVLNGVYLQMGARGMYGRDLSYGLLSVLGRSYDTTLNPSIGSLYYQGARYNFNDPTVRAAINTIWDSSYQCIANLNYLLEQAEKRKSIFTENHYELLRGEVLAVRAYLHFDLLRMFGPADARNNLATLAIPYVTKLSPYAIPAVNTGAVLDACLTDLKEAETLLKNPVKTSGHIGYWGIRGLQARIYLYKGDLANAGSYANGIISSGAFPLAKTNTDVWFAAEHLFNLLVYSNTLSAYERSVFNVSTPLGLLPANQTALYITGSGNTNDWRRSGAFVDPATNNPVNTTNPNAVIMPRKFSSSTNNILPMIRTTEMYYIAAECAVANNDNATATTLLNAVRAARNVPAYGLAALPADSLSAEIGREYQKEMLGEAQVFFYFKRKNLPIASLPFTIVAVIPGATYVFPKPE